MADERVRPRTRRSRVGKFAVDSALEETVTSELVSGANSLLAGKIQGNTSNRARLRIQRRQRLPLNQRVIGRFPTPHNREFLPLNRELKRRIREISEVIRQTPHRAPFESFGRFSEIRSAGQISNVPS
jgi:hypothetical protein